ncbi:hypothetical protein MPTA7396_5910 [Mycoplasmoides pneumoniae]|nr:Uncharacterised protein [Mycoplasmoides pneumoniae]GLL57631.1 hypothetical protein KPI25BX_3930 [Mycoplasmoides pneumoniae]GLL58016.1 hypothetical protein Y1241N_0630 [Mycoplasmoides pneumoniae]GLL58926.1 hypothetical protein Y12242BV_2500 [Mycoplasmoides pneumoniae]GLL59691.1 hypothetical protein Y12382J_2970 [Mycoplasmoides pneumoniae]
MFKLGWASFVDPELAKTAFLEFAKQFYVTSSAGAILFDLKKSQGLDQLQAIEKTRKVIITEQFANQTGKWILFDKENTKRINSLAQEHITPLIKRILRLADFKNVLINVQHHKKLQKCLLWEINGLICLVESLQFMENPTAIMEWFQGLKKHCPNVAVVTISGQHKPVIEPSLTEYKAVFGSSLLSFHLDATTINNSHLVRQILEQIKIKATLKSNSKVAKS